MSLIPKFESNKSLKALSTFGIGGNARLFIEVFTTREMIDVLTYCHQKNIPFFILGKGSNCLFDDRGIDGAVIHNKISYCHIKKTEIDVGSGYSFSLLGVKTAKQGLSGLEFASGIPATVGGAIFMNAGANGGETKDCLSEIGFVDAVGKLIVYRKNEIEFGYRFSSFQQKKGAIVFAKFLANSSPSARKEQLQIVEYRIKTQPYEDPSIGCVFKNPERESAGALIEKSGLKGVRIGGVAVSTKHANFIVNVGNGTAADVKALVDLVKDAVMKQCGIELQEEVRCIPYQME